MTLKSLSDDKPVGVIGAGNFGTAVANLLAPRRKVLLYARDADVIREIAETREHRGHKMHPNVTPLDDLEHLADVCDVIFPIVPSAHFRPMMQRLSEYLHPYHILIHGTKGFDIQLGDGETIESVKTLHRGQVKTMSEVITEESVVVRVGCLAGPNLCRSRRCRRSGCGGLCVSSREFHAAARDHLRRIRFAQRARLPRHLKKPRPVERADQ